MRNRPVLPLFLAGALVLAAAATRPIQPVGAASVSFSFGAAGDFGAGDTVTNTLTNMAGSRLNFALALGDLSYNEIQPAAAWCAYVKQNVGSLPFELISGNHEDGGDVAQGLIWDFASCLPNAMSDSVGTYSEQYYFDYPEANPLARFIMISPGLSFSNGDSFDYNSGGADYQWVSQAIDSARAQGIQWIIVGMHKVCLTTGGSDCDIGTDLINLLISKHVDLILEGHDHNYQRSKQIAFNGTTCTSVTPTDYNASCIVNSGANGVYREGAGTVIVIQGTGGIDDEFGAIYENPDSPYFEVASGSNLNPQKGFVKYTVSPAEIRATFVPSTHTSDFADSFVIRGRQSPPTLKTLFRDNFDHQAPGALELGPTQGTFTGDEQATGLRVETATHDSPPHALSVPVMAAGGAYAFEQYGGPGYATHVLQFHFRLGNHFALAPGSYLVVAQTRPDTASDAGKVDIVVSGANDAVRVDYFDSGGGQHFLWTNASLRRGVWDAITLRESVTPSGATISLYVNGVVVGSTPLLNLGGSPITYFAIGDQYTPAGVGTRGHLFFDDVIASGG